jgi:CsoR family transcriptional regulator, copper-sensing transcriptional repressor
MLHHNTTIRGIPTMADKTAVDSELEDEATREHKKSVLDRLRRVEGQVRGLQRMVEEGKPCADTVTQISAVMGAMKRVAAIMVACSMRQAIQCAASDCRDPEKELDKLMDAFAKMA